MKLFSKIVVAALLISSVSLESCKKGEGDPALSLRSRKARLAGEWKVTAGVGKTVTGSLTSNWTYDGTTQTTTVSPFPAITDKFTIEYTFEKDGTFKLVNTDNNGSTPSVETTTGTWNFSGGVGEEKNKSKVILTTLSEVSGSTTTTYTGGSAPTQILDIYQLKNKEIIIKIVGTTSSTAGSSSFETEWTLTLK